MVNGGKQTFFHENLFVLPNLVIMGKTAWACNRQEKVDAMYILHVLIMLLESI